jgi:hypothetical protein
MKGGPGRNSREPHGGDHADRENGGDPGHDGERSGGARLAHVETTCLERTPLGSSVQGPVCLRTGGIGTAGGRGFRFLGLASGRAAARRHCILMDFESQPGNFACRPSPAALHRRESEACE